MKYEFTDGVYKSRARRRELRRACYIQVPTQVVKIQLHLLQRIIKNWLGAL
jgi:hypothetical protein